MDPGFDAFPSGHMLVVAALMSVLVRFYPKARPYCMVVGGLLALALILTAYHFLSDIIAGAYLGIAIEAALFAALSAHPDRLV
jgi:membrane-associated phospholipid phosphatase